jgi:hypothetical protein
MQHHGIDRGRQVHSHQNARADREVFSSLKREFSARAPGHSLPMQVRQALLLDLSFNLHRPEASLPSREDVNRAR